MSLDGKVFIVTGAGGNLGTATLALLAGRGARLVAVERAEAGLRQALAALADPAPHLGLADIDLTDETHCAMVVSRTLDRYGRLDGVATTVGGFAAGSAADTDAALLLRMVTLNVVTTLNILRAALPPMRLAGTGSLVAVGAASALRPPAGIAAYAAAKRAMMTLVESFADEIRADGVRLNAVLPGTIDTPQNRAASPGADHASWVTPSQIAEVIGFLLSDAAGGVHGVLLPVLGRA